MSDHDTLCRQQHWEGGDCFDCRLIAKVRADERARILDSLHTQRELADDDQRWADLRAKVEALRGKWQRSVDRDPDGKLSGYDRAHVAALGDVLALIDGSSDE